MEAAAPNRPQKLEVRLRTVENMTLDGGIACLDFANSGFDTGSEPVERLRQYEDLLTLAKRLSLFPSSHLKKLSRYAVERPRQAAAALARSVECRDLVFTVFEAIANGRKNELPPDALPFLNHHLSEAQSKRVLRWKGGILEEGWDLEKEDLLHPLWAFLVSCQELITKHDQHMIRQCEGCRWLFLDTSKSHRRKWCNMQDCGSLHKSRRYYERRIKTGKR